MFAEIFDKYITEGKSKRESYLEFIRLRNWSKELAWDGQKHQSCPGKKQGTWRVTGYGFYQGADWAWRWFLGHRCTQCGCMVQHSQITDASGENPQPIRREVIIP